MRKGGGGLGSESERLGQAANQAAEGEDILVLIVGLAFGWELARKSDFSSLIGLVAVLRRALQRYDISDKTERRKLTEPERCGRTAAG